MKTLHFRRHRCAGRFTHVWSKLQKLRAVRLGVRHEPSGSPIALVVVGAAGVHVRALVSGGRIVLGEGGEKRIIKR